MQVLLMQWYCIFNVLGFWLDPFEKVLPNCYVTTLCDDSQDNSLCFPSAALVMRFVWFSFSGCSGRVVLHQPPIDAFRV